MLAGLRRMSRDNARTPVQWDGSEHAGFTTGEPWIPVNPNYVSINAEADRGAEQSVFDFYRRLIELRHTSSTVALGAFTLLEPEHPTLYAFTRDGEGEQLLVVANVSGEPLEVPLLAGWRAEGVLVTNYPAAPRAASTLAPWEVRVYRRALG